MTDEAATALIREAMPLAATLSISAETYTPERVVLTLEWAPNLCTTNGILHGGALMALADSAGGACALLNLPQDASGTATIESKTNFLGAVRAGAVTATSAPLHRGRTTIVVETEVSDSAGRLIAKVTQTQMVLRRR
jgi:1,4-dihydroxy-2-naphthoyl-CoA hydrolase